MNTSELQSLKMAWIAAKEANDTQAQLRLLREHPEQQSSLIDFIAGFYATNTGVAETQNESLSLLTQRAFATALDRKSTRLNSSHQIISYAVFCLKKKK